MQLERVMGIIIGILMIAGLCVGLGYGVFRTHDGKNLRDLLRANVVATQVAAHAREDAAATRAQLEKAIEESIHYQEVARKALARLEHYEEYVRGRLEKP